MIKLQTQGEQRDPAPALLRRGQATRLRTQGRESSDRLPSRLPASAEGLEDEGREVSRDDTRLVHPDGKRLVRMNGECFVRQDDSALYAHTENASMVLSSDGIRLECSQLLDGNHDKKAYWSHHPTDLK